MSSLVQLLPLVLVLLVAYFLYLRARTSRTWRLYIGVFVVWYVGVCTLLALFGWGLTANQIRNLLFLPPFWINVTIAIWRWVRR